ncbi:helix-turn-helix domain-containing protein [Desulforhopalus singaporensis]|uniref:helix-turn-helix domain-containing protein n=1 Tax=Desulforhopalus singaporensis TaxID=91360 RepID=UPI000B8A5857|nr:helix-turn-helix domain-containing protein [Desulforhopalus singaporensis]
MKNTDGRNLSREVQQHNRNLAIHLFQAGKTRKEIAEIVSIHYNVVCRWIRAWQKGGDQAIEQLDQGKWFFQKMIDWHKKLLLF